MVHCLGVVLVVLMVDWKDVLKAAWSGEKRVEYLVALKVEH